MLNLDYISQDNGSEEGINISPLIDIVFILLLFFVVTSVFVEETGVEVNKPDSSQAQSLNRQSILIAISADGRVFHGGQEIGLFGIGPTLNRFAVSPDQPVIIQADGLTSTQVLISALDEVKAAGLENVNVATRTQ
ncbi:MAG: biopolymer transporter ExbD [Opitutaceae bacterium]